MANLLSSNSRKSAAVTAAEERVMRARAGHASFAKSMAQQSTVKSEAAPARKAFISSFGGTTDAPTAKEIAISRKADKLEALPENAKRACQRFDDDTKSFIAALYASHKANGEAVTFTASEAGAVMKRDPESARRCVEALVSTGILMPSYSPMGSLKGYVPAILD